LGSKRGNGTDPRNCVRKQSMERFRKQSLEAEHGIVAGLENELGNRARKRSKEKEPGN
jgi:hypothetical protein